METWASSEGLAGVLRFEAGTLAGTPTADFVFILAFGRVLEKARAAASLCARPAVGADQVGGRVKSGSAAHSPNDCLEKHHVHVHVHAQHVRRRREQCAQCIQL